MLGEKLLVSVVHRYLFLTFIFVGVNLGFAQIRLPSLSATAEATIDQIQKFTPSVRGVGDSIVSSSERIINSTFNILRLPLGAVQSTVGWPFGYLNEGLYNIKRGVKGAGSVVKEVILLPFELIGLLFPIFNQ